MSESRTKNVKRNLIFGYLNRGIRILFPFVVRTILIYQLGIEYAGLNSLFTSIISVLSLSELGFGTAMVFSMYEPISNNDTAKICALLRYYRKIYRIIGAAILGIGLLLIPFLPLLVKGESPPNINLYYLYIIYLSNTFVSYFLFSYKHSLLTAYQRQDINGKISMATYALLYIAQAVSLLTIRNYYAYIIILPISTVLNNLVTEYLSRKSFPEINASGTLGKEDEQKIIKNVKALIGHKFSNIFTTAFDNIIISSVLGLAVLSIFSNYHYIIISVFGLLGVIDTAILASVGNSIVKESKEKNYSDFRKFNFMYVCIVGWCSIFLLCLYQHFISIWIGNDYLLPFSTAVVFVLYFYTWKFRETVEIYKNACGLWREDIYRPYYSSTINLVLNIALVKTIGITGVLFSTIIVMLTINLPIPTSVVFKRYFKVSTRKFYINMLLYTITFTIAGCISYFICSLLPNHGIAWFVLKVIVCCLVPVPILGLSFWKLNECRDARKFVLGMIKRRRYGVS